MGILSWIVVGLIAGWLAGLVMRRGGYGLAGDVIIGVVGGLLGGGIAAFFLHINVASMELNLLSILVAFAGSVVFILFLRLVGGRRRLNEPRQL